MATPADAHAETIADVHEVFANAHYTLSRDNKKTRGYTSNNGHIVYLSLAQAIAPWRVAMHPGLTPDLARMPGIEIAPQLYHGSNMVEFPTERWTGQRDIFRVLVD